MINKDKLKSPLKMTNRFPKITRNKVCLIILLSLSILIFHCKTNSSDNKKKKALSAYGLIANTKVNNGNIIIQTGNAVVTTVADSLKVGYPTGLTIDSIGTIYLVDQRASVIRTITSAGVATVMAGSLVGGAQGYVDATGTAARFNSPIGVARDTSGNLYIADFGNYVIRKITSGGTVSTFAGNGVNGFMDGVGTAARFNSPRGIAIDTNGNLYIADMDNHAIRKVTPAGVVTTVTGNGNKGFVDGNGTNARFYGPCGVAVDTNGNLYISELGNHAIRKITSTGIVTTVAGNGNKGFVDSNGTASQFNGPCGIVVDGSNNIYVGDGDNNAISKIDSSGLVRTIAGNGYYGNADGIGTSASFYIPDGLVLNEIGNLYVTDYGNGLLRYIKLNP